MVKTLWISGAFALLLWSLAAWGLAGRRGGGGYCVVPLPEAGAGYVPEAPLAVQSLIAFFQRFGDALLWLAWASGALLIVLATWLSTVLLQALRRGSSALLARWEAAHATSARGA